MKNKGQALVEFVLILPVLLLLIFAFLDLSRIMIGKNHLESVMSEVVKLINKNQDIEDIQSYLNTDKDYKISIKIQNEKYTNITLVTKIDLITPGLKQILNNPYVLEVERSIIDE